MEDEKDMVQLIEAHFTTVLRKAFNVTSNPCGDAIGMVAAKLINLYRTERFSHHMEFWRGHKRKVYVSLGLCGSGYLLYKFYDAYIKRIYELERQLADEQENDELLKAQ